MFIIALLAATFPAVALGQGVATRTGNFYSREQALNISFAESMTAIQRVTVSLRFDEAGKLVGTIVLDPNRLHFDELGEQTGRETEQAEATLECTLTFQKEVEGKRLYSVRGPKISSRLSMVILPIEWSPGRLLVHNKDGSVKHMIELYQPLPEPCHPGCFPKGSLVRTGDDVTPIEKLHVGDLVTIIDADGRPGTAKVVEAFENRNALIELRVEGSKLITTRSQPLAIEGGEFRAAGDVKAGDRLLRWTGDKPAAAPVIEVTPAAKDAAVYNLVLGEPTTFVVGDFMVQSKPPPVAVPAP